jgi:hypothetical protein
MLLCANLIQIKKGYNRLRVVTLDFVAPSTGLEPVTL